MTKLLPMTAIALLLFATPAFAGELINSDNNNTNTNLNIPIASSNPEQNVTTITKSGAGAGANSEASSPNSLSNQYKTRANALGISLQRNPVQPGHVNPNIFGSPEQNFSLEIGPLYSQSRTGPTGCMMSGPTAAAAMSLTLATTVSNYYGMDTPGVKGYWEEASKQVGYAIENCVNSD